jgi:HAD superfamily hydrolase (TIGR01509 family)
MPPAAILDIDGTLVDTNYHHAVAWFRAFKQSGVVVPIWQIHRHMGMGGDHLVAELTSKAFDDEHGDDVRTAEKELIEELKRLGHHVVLASSAKANEVEHYLDLLDARELADAWTTSADVKATKPEPDLVVAAIEKAGGGDAVMVGDTVWDVEAARRAGIETIGVLTGGYAESELRGAGAVCVFESIHDLRDRLDETPLAG